MTGKARVTIEKERAVTDARRWRRFSSLGEPPKERMTAKRTADIPSFMVMDVMARSQALEKAGEDVVHLEVGEPDFDTPEVIREAALDAIRAGDTHYTHALGLLRAISRCSTA